MGTHNDFDDAIDYGELAGNLNGIKWAMRFSFVMLILALIFAPLLVIYGLAVIPQGEPGGFHVVLGISTALIFWMVHVVFIKAYWQLRAIASVDRQNQQIIELLEELD